jgi:hypothetical protein
MKSFLLVLSSVFASTANGSALLRGQQQQQRSAHRLSENVPPSFTTFLQLNDDLRQSVLNHRSSSLIRNDPIPPTDPNVVVGSNVGQYGVNDKLNNLRLVVEKNTGFAVPVKAVDAKHPCPASTASPCEENLTPLEKKVKDAEAQVVALAKTRKIEAETLESRIRREQEITDAAIEKQLTTQEKLSADEDKLERLKHALNQAEVAATKRKQLLVDPNRFTDSCAPGFRIYFTGEAKVCCAAHFVAFFLP